MYIKEKQHSINLASAVDGISHLVFVLEGPYVVETRRGEERRGVAEQFTAGSYRKKHLQHTPDGDRKREK